MPIQVPTRAETIESFARLRAQILGAYLDRAPRGTQARLADALSVSAGAITNWKSGKGLVKTDLAGRAQVAAEVLDAPPLPGLWRSVALPAMVEPRTMWRHNFTAYGKPGLGVGPVG